MRIDYGKHLFAPGLYPGWLSGVPVHRLVQFLFVLILVIFIPQTTLEATQGQMDGFFSQLSFKCYLLEVATVGD